MNPLKSPWHTWIKIASDVSEKCFQNTYFWIKFCHILCPDVMWFDACVILSVQIFRATVYTCLLLKLLSINGSPLETCQNVLSSFGSRDFTWLTLMNVSVYRLSSSCLVFCYSLGSLQEIIYQVCCRRMWLTWAKPRSVLHQKPLGWSETKKTSQATLPNIIAWPRWCSSVWMWANPCSYFPTSIPRNLPRITTSEVWEHTGRYDAIEKSGRTLW